MSRFQIRTSLDLLEYDAPTGRMLVEGSPVTYHCNVFNHFFAKGVKLALGESEGREVIYRASEFAYYRLFKSLKEKYGLDDKETYALGMDFFRSRGLGVLDIKGPSRIYLLASTHAHTYIKVLKSFSDLPVCDVERGFVAGLLEAALDAEPGNVYVEESSCIGAGDPVCKLEVEVRRDRVEYPEPDYSKVTFYEVEGTEDREKTMEEIMPMIPEPDDSGIIALDSAFTDINKVWISQLPGEYYAYANMMVADLADKEVARYALTLAGFNCVFFTYVSIARSPIGEILLRDAYTEDDYFRKLAEMGNYFGFGVFKVGDLKKGGECVCDLRLYNFYENNYLLALGRDAISYFLPGAALAQIMATYRYSYYDRNTGTLGAINSIFEDFDKAYESMKFEMEFDPSKNEQRVGLKVKM